MADRRIELANISRVNEILKDDDKARIITSSPDTGLCLVDFYESKKARLNREAREQVLREYERNQIILNQPVQPQNGNVKRGPGRPPKAQLQAPVPVVTEEKKSRFGLGRGGKDQTVQQNRCVVCGSPNANIIKFQVPGAPTTGETRFCKQHSNITDLTNIPLGQAV